LGAGDFMALAIIIGERALRGRLKPDFLQERAKGAEKKKH